MFELRTAGMILLESFFVTLDVNKFENILTICDFYDIATNF